MKVCITTSVFHLRKSRQLEYYTLPAIHLLEDLTESDIDIILFTDQDKEIFPKGRNIHIIQSNPEFFIKQMWKNPDWKREYQTMLNARNEQAEQSKVPELLAIWLGKFPMMNIASEFGDHILWMDSGIRLPRIFGKDLSKYTKCQLYPDRFKQFVEKTLSKNPLAFMTCDNHPFLLPYHGIVMRKYGRVGNPLIRAGFILARGSEVSILQDQVKDKWDLLVKNKDYGTEENPMTLLSWVRPDISLISYDDWLDGLGMR